MLSEIGKPNIAATGKRVKTRAMRCAPPASLSTSSPLIETNPSGHASALWHSQKGTAPADRSELSRLNLWYVPIGGFQTTPLANLYSH